MLHPQTCQEGQLKVMGKVTDPPPRTQGLGNRNWGVRRPASSITPTAPLVWPLQVSVSLCLTFNLQLFPPFLQFLSSPLSSLILPCFHFLSTRLLLSYFPSSFHFLFSLLSILFCLSFRWSLHSCLYVLCLQIILSPVYKSSDLSVLPPPVPVFLLRGCPCLTTSHPACPLLCCLCHSLSWSLSVLPLSVFLLPSCLSPMLQRWKLKPRPPAFRPRLLQCPCPPPSPPAAPCPLSQHKFSVSSFHLIPISWAPGDPLDWTPPDPSLHLPTQGTRNPLQ